MSDTDIILDRAVFVKYPRAGLNPMGGMASRVTARVAAAGSPVTPHSFNQGNSACDAPFIPRLHPWPLLCYNTLGFHGANLSYHSIRML